MSVLVKKKRKKVYFRSDLNFDRRIMHNRSFTILDSSVGGKKIMDISSHLWWWLWLFLVRFKTEIMSVLAKKKRKKVNFRSDLKLDRRIMHALQFNTVRGAEKIKGLSSHLNLLWWLELVRFKTETMSVLAIKKRKKVHLRSDMKFDRRIMHNRSFKILDSSARRK